MIAWLRANESEILIDPVVLGELHFGILAKLRASGESMPVKDSLIAASALTHDLTVVTHNRADFQKAGVRVVDPFENN